jgi:LmbE family N-acetylglucosaminyl deacetylase
MRDRQVFDLSGAWLLIAAVTAQLPSPIVRHLWNSVPVQRDVFVVAHQDDWQLFMGDIVAKRVRAGSPATFIYLTAGDNGRDSLYWLTRERAALKSTRLVADADAAPSSEFECSVMKVLEHSIRKCVVGNTESYFMRLPDGERNGLGFPSNNYQSLRTLRAKRISAITAVDGSATYSGWEDLATTARSLIASSSRNVGNPAGEGVVVHSNDPSVATNPHDHFDHRIAGLLVEELRKKENWNTRYYVGYALATRAANRSNEQVRDKTAIFMAYDSEMMRINKAWSAYREHPSFYSECLLRTYARSARAR